MTPTGTIAVIPVRSLTTGKTRLAGRLSAAERAELTSSMLRTVVAAALEAEAIAAVLIVSSDPSVLTLAATFGPRVTALPQAADVVGLNGAIEQGLTEARRRGASSLLVLFADLPLLTGEDVRSLLRRDAPIVIAPDRHGAGTNALLLRLDAFTERFPFQFGPGSYHRHVEAAHRLGLDVVTRIGAGTAFDLDTADDLDRLGAAPVPAGNWYEGGSA